MSERERVRRQMFGTLMMNALLRWESYVTLIVTAILFLGVGDFQLLGVQLPAVFWLLLGGAAEGALIASTLTDPEETQEAMAREFESKYNLAQVRNSVSRERLRTAMEYRRNMIALAKRQKGALRGDQLATIDLVNNWIAAMYDLAQHIDASEGNELVERDLRMVPQRIEKVKIRIERESDPRVINDLESQLKLLEKQKLNLEATKNSVKRAEIQLESTLSSLGTIYAQMTLLGTKGEVDSNRYQRLRLEIQDEVNSVQDTIEAMDEVQMHALSRFS